MKALLENLPDEYAAMLGGYFDWSVFVLMSTFAALMCWFVTLASKMTGTEIPGVGMAPGGKIVKPEQEVAVKPSKFFSFVSAAGEGAPLQHAGCCRGDVGKQALELPCPVLYPEGDVDGPADHRSGRFC